MVEVDQRDLPYAAARQRFCRPRADAANTYNGHVRAKNGCCASSAIQAANAAKAARRINDRNRHAKSRR